MIHVAAIAIIPLAALAVALTRHYLSKSQSRETAFYYNFVVIPAFAIVGIGLLLLTALLADGKREASGNFPNALMLELFAGWIIALVILARTFRRKP